MNKSSNEKRDKVTLIVVVTIFVTLLVFFAILLPLMIEGNKDYYNKTIVVGEVNFVDPVDYSNSFINVGIIDTDGEGYIISRHFDVTMKVGEMYDIQYYVVDNKGPRIISKIKPDLYIVTYNCDVIGDVCK